MSAFDHVLEALEAGDLRVSRNGVKAEAQCPAHDDRNASLSVGSGEDDRVLLHCHAGCPTEDILAAVGLNARDLFNENGDRHREIVATYNYSDEADELLFQVVRFKPKDFRQRRPDGHGGWVWSLNGTRRVLFRLPEVLAAVQAGKRIWIVEGERDVLALEQIGVVASCNPMGAGKWRQEYGTVLKGADVVVVADRDEPGLKHARQVAASLTGVAAKVVLVGCPNGHKDISQHLDAGGTLVKLEPLDPNTPDNPLESPSVDARGGRQLVLTSATAIRSERIRWAWRPRLPLRSLSVIAGEKGLGKSLLTNARLVAEATRGKLPGELEGQPIDVLICTAEDDWRSVVKPRLIAHGADLDRVHRVTVEDDAADALLTLPDDVPLLEAQIQRLRSEDRTVGMMVIDRISAFLSQSTDTHRDASVRRALAPLAAMAERLDLVVVVVAHLTKDDSARLINRVSGSGAFVNAARSVLVLAPSPDDPDGEQGSERVLVHVCGNWGRAAPTLAARVESRDVELDDGSTTSVGYIEIIGETEINVDDLQRARDENSAADIEEAIGAALLDGPRPSREVKTQIVAELACSKRTVERAAVRMAELGELLIESRGYPRTTTWHSTVATTPRPTVATQPPAQ